MHAVTAAPSDLDTVGTSLADRAYVAIRDQLIMLEIRPGEPIDDDELARSLGVGRTPVREALKRLEGDRLVVTYPRRGTFATGMDITDLAQIAADRLPVDLAKIAFEFSDSARTPPGIGTFASRSVAMGGSAVALATEALGEKCRRLVADTLGVTEDELSWDEHGLTTGDGRRMSLAQLADAEPGLEAEARFESGLVFSSGTYAAVVEIEPSTGRLLVTRVAAVDDAGTIVNPLLAEGQVLGGTAQGLGECLV